MQATDETRLTLTQAAALLQRRELSPLELTDAYLRRIERLNPHLNAYVTVTAERAREDARRATEQLGAGASRGPLHGVPIALKDLYDTAGIRTAGGAKILADRVPGADATAARRLREAGTVLLGKLNTHELAFGVTTTNPHFGATRNPWDPERIPGGSSGGAGAAVAAGLAAATLGTDTGGSIRIPASLCGCVGLKPTYGRVSKAGVLPLSRLLDHAGPLTATVEDAARLLQVVAGYDPDDGSTVPVPVPDYAAALGEGVRGLRVGVPRGYFFDRLDDEVRSAVERALGVLHDLGAELHEVAVPDFGPIALPAFGLAVADLLDLYGEQRGAERVLERLPRTQVGREREGADELGQPGLRVAHAAGVRHRRSIRQDDRPALGRPRGGRATRAALGARTPGRRRNAGRSRHRPRAKGVSRPPRSGGGRRPANAGRGGRPPGGAV